MRQDPSFEKRKDKHFIYMLLMASMSNMITRAPTNTGKVQDTKYAQNKQGAINPQNAESDTHQNNAIDPVREQRRFYWKIAMTSKQSQSLRNGQQPSSSGKMRLPVLSALKNGA